MMDEAAAREIERLKDEISKLREIMLKQVDFQSSLICQLKESERQRKALAEHLEALGIEGINAATGAGK